MHTTARTRGSLRDLLAFALATLPAASGCGNSPLLIPADSSFAARDGGDASAGTMYRNGSVVISQLSAFSGVSVVPLATTTASFLDVPAGAGVTYDIRTDGACRVVRVTAPADVLAGRGANYNVAAGAVTVHGGSATAADVRLVPDAQGRYARDTLMVERWAPGDAVTISAEGGDAVPALQSVLVFPARPTVLTPASPPLGTSVELPPTGFTATWVPDARPDARVAIRIFQPALPGGTTAVTIECIYPASEGTGTVPTSILREFSPRYELVLNVAGTADARVTAGTMPVDLVLQNVGLNGAAARYWE